MALPLIDKDSKFKDFHLMSRVRIKLFFEEEEKRVCTLASKFACVIALNDET